MIVRVHHTDADGASLGYSYHPTMKAATQYIKRYGGMVCDTATTPKTKKDILKILTFWAGHADNG